MGPAACMCVQMTAVLHIRNWNMTSWFQWAVTQCKCTHHACPLVMANATKVTMHREAKDILRGCTKPHECLLFRHMCTSALRCQLDF